MSIILKQNKLKNLRKASLVELLACLSKELNFIQFFFLLPLDRKSTRLNSSHVSISYAVFCLKKKNIYNYLFGSASAVSKTDFYSILLITMFSVLLMTLYYIE